jgi:hypothetical protein
MSNAEASRSGDRYVVTRRDGVDTLHKNPREECNLDDTLADRQVDEFEAEAMLIEGAARPCQHCDLAGGAG